MSDLSPDQLALLKQAREANLLKAWAGGRRKLSPAELAEIAHLIPASPPPPASSLEALPEPLRRHRAPKYQHKLSEYEAIFETKIRQLRRWVAVGVEAEDPPPLDDPPRMAVWWAKHMKHRIPPKIAALAAIAPKAPAPTASDAPQGVLPPSSGIDLGILGQNAGMAVEQARALVDGAYAKLKAAYAAGEDALIRLWHPRWEKTVEALRKQEKDEVVARKAQGLVIDRAGVEADLAQALASFKRMRELMARGVCEFLRREIPDIDPLILARVSEAIEITRAKEDDLFRDLSSLKTPADVEFKLVA